MLQKIALPLAGAGMFAWFILPQIVILWTSVNSNLNTVFGAF